MGWREMARWVSGSASLCNFEIGFGAGRWSVPIGPELPVPPLRTARKTFHLGAAREQCDSEHRVKAEGAAQMGESAYLRSLSTFVLGTLPRDPMWTNHDPG